MDFPCPCLIIEWLSKGNLTTMRPANADGCLVLGSSCGCGACCVWDWRRMASLAWYIGCFFVLSYFHVLSLVNISYISFFSNITQLLRIQYQYISVLSLGSSIASAVPGPLRPLAGIDHAAEQGPHLTRKVFIFPHKTSTSWPTLTKNLLRSAPAWAFVQCLKTSASVHSGLCIISLEVHGIWLAVKPHLWSEVAPHQQLTQGVLRMLRILQILITFEILRFAWGTQE